jgi:hypothetical protein
MAIIFRHNRRSLLIFVMSNKFALSDIKEYAQRHANVALVSWLDSPEISPLACEISI